MVRRVFGNCGGAAIACSLNPATGRWETAVPAAPDGTYILELWAEDWAGNVGYFATIEITYDSTQLCFVFRILDVGATFSLTDVQGVLCGEAVEIDTEPDGLRFAVLPEEIRTRVVRCEVCGE